MTAVVVISVVLGAVLGALFGPDDLDTVRRVVGGAIAGAGIAYLLIASRSLGAFGDDDPAEERDSAHRR